MTKSIRVGAYKHKKKRGEKKGQNPTKPQGERVAEGKLIQAGVDVENLKNRMELMTAEQMANCQQVASQNALKLFNEMLEEVKKRLPKMKDEVIVSTLLSIWDKTGSGK
jgi:hypothetical protein